MSVVCLRLRGIACMLSVEVGEIVCQFHVGFEGNCLYVVC